MEHWHFFCATFGCKVNQYETQALREAWIRAGGAETAEPARADVLLVNSCAITARGERDARNALVRLRRESPQALLVLTGCAARLVADFVPRRGAPRPEADLLVPPERKEELASSAFADWLAQWLAAQAKGLELPRSPFAGHPGPMPRTAPGERRYPALAVADYRRTRPVLKVQEGCTHRCTYCIVPSARGGVASRAPGEAVLEASRLLERHGEIMISGINLGQYGRDRPEFGGFWDLLERIDGELAPRFAGRARLRISSLEPSQLDDRGLGVLRRSVLVAPHLHISLQHASQRILKRMGRGHYAAGAMLEAAGRLAEFWPGMGLGCDVILGFPGETPADVDELCRFLEGAPVTYAHVFPYSRRPGTPAASFPEQVPRQEKLARARAVREVVRAKARAFWEQEMRLPSLQLVPDMAEEAGGAPAGLVHAVDERYAPCWIKAEDMPADQEARFIEARPVRLLDAGLLAEPVRS